MNIVSKKELTSVLVKKLPKMLDLQLKIGYNRQNSILLTFVLWRKIQKYKENVK